MTTLYKSPDIVLGDFEWHLMVRLHYGRATMEHYFRPLTAARHRWSNIGTWQGSLPSQFRNRFAPFRRHALIAIALHEQRAKAVLARERIRATRQAVAA